MRRRSTLAPIGPNRISDASGDPELIAAVRAGDRAALEILLRRHYDLIHAVCRRITGTSVDADDAAQETLVKIVRSLDRFDGRSAFSTWAYRIATNTALDELRRRRRRPHLELVEDRPVSEPGIEMLGDALAIDTALGELADEQRVPIVLRDVVGMDYAEIAAVLDLPVGTVKSRIARGRERLSAHLGNQGSSGRRQTEGGNETPAGPSATDPPPTVEP